MVNWQAPETLLLDSLVLVKIVHFMDGIYIWDWLMGLPYEWRLLTRKEQWRWPMLIYLACRISAITAVVLTLAIINATTEINCSLVTRAGDISGSVAISMSSVLIALRAVAVWRQHKSIIVVAVLLSAANIASLIRSVIPDPGVYWDPLEQACHINFDITVQGPRVWVSFATDLILIIVMLVGLDKYKGSGALSKLVFQQGVIWCIVAVVGYIPSVVMIILNLNAPLSLSAQMPTCLVMVLCTTSMQRRLSEYRPPFLLPTSALAHSGPLFARRSVYLTKESAVQHPISLPKPAFTTPERLGSHSPNINNLDIYQSQMSESIDGSGHSYE